MKARGLVCAKVTFVWFGGEVTAIFRATKTPEECRWHREEPSRSNGFLTCYAHVGQHGECSPSLLKCRRVPEKDYEPLKREMESLYDYRITPFQKGRLTIRS